MIERAPATAAQPMRPVAARSVAGRRRATLAGVAVAALAALTGAPRTARAEVAVNCEFFEISAKTGGKPAMDGDLKPLEKKLRKPPLSTWNQFKLLTHSQKALAKKKPEPIRLKIGSAAATLVETVDNSKVRLTLTMDDPKGKQVVNNTTTVEAGDYVIVVHELAGNEGHLLSAICK